MHQLRESFELFRFSHLFVLLTLLVGACEKERQSPVSSSARPLFSEVATASGLDFVHYTGATGDFFLPEIMGAGCAFLDYDGDGDLDVYAVQGALIDKRKTLEDSLDSPPSAAPGNVLFRNDLIGAGSTVRLAFTNVTKAAGVGHEGYGMGCAVGDYDNDGRPDLYVTNFGPNVLYHNQGDGTFADVTRRAGVDDRRFSASAAFLDYDRDGHLDLFVTSYVDFSVATHRDCVRLGGQRDYCGPLSYRPVADRLFRNRGDGTFADASVAAGIQRDYGNGLGVVCDDFNDDGWIDVFVANDASPNQLWINRRNGSFENEALLAGVAVNAAGRNEAGMGVCAADFDHDGDPDLVLTHEKGETNTFYENLGGGYYEDATSKVGLAEPSLAFAGFGVESLDYDADGWPDLFVTNGAVRILAELVGERHPYYQRDQLFRNVGGRFVEVAAASGVGGDPPLTGRGVARGDIDNDGDIDLLVSSNRGPLRLYLNEHRGRHSWVTFSLEGTRAHRDAYGALVVLAVSTDVVLRERVGTDGSYLSASDKRVHFGLADATRVDSVTVHWLGGGAERWTDIKLNTEVRLREGTGEVLKE